MIENLHLPHFNPQLLDAETLEAIFVQRHDLAADTVERIRESALTGNKHHLLLVGTRGSGKTHFVSLIFHRIQKQADLKDKLRVAWLGEDETTTSFLDLLLRIYRALAQRYPHEFPLPRLDPIFALPADDAVKRLGKLILETLDQRTLLVLVENLDDVFAGLGDRGQKQWRAYIQQNPVFTTLATSQKLFAGISSRQAPFFGFFQTEHLKPLSVDEAVLLLCKIAEWKKDTDLADFLQTPEGRARVRALYHLSGGNHRIYVVLSQFIDRDTLDDLVGLFEKMLDELTPYYQARLQWLSPQQRKLVEFLCASTRPVPVKEMAQRNFMTHQTTTGQLRELREKGYVQSHARGRESLYELTEPLMRMCVEVKENRRQPIRLIVDFLRLWYRRDHLEAWMKRMGVEAVKSRQYVQHALMQIDRGEEDLCVKYTLEDMKKYIDHNDKEGILHTLQELTQIRGEAKDWFDLACFYYSQKNFEEALVSIGKAIELDPANPNLWYDRGIALGDLGRYEEALVAYDKVTELSPEDARGWYNRGVVLVNLGRYKEALTSYERSIELKPEDAITWINHGAALFELSRFKEALAALDQAINLNSEDATTWNNRGAVLTELGRHEEALVAIRKAVELDPEEASSWSNWASVLGRLGRREEALAIFDKVVEINPGYATAWNNRGVALMQLGRYDEALASLTKCLTLEPDDPNCIVNLAETFFGLRRWAEGFQTLEEHFHKHPPQNENHAGDTQSIIHMVLTSSLDKDTWKQRVERLIEIYSTGKALPHLGEGLIRNLARIDVAMLSIEALQAWLEVWQEAGSAHPKLQLPLRIFATGIHYLQSKDEQVFLDLVEEERKILAEVLHPENSGG
jgi:tetratricopeptide (TPR) repeat protein